MAASPLQNSQGGVITHIPISLLFKMERKYILLMITLAISPVDTWQIKFGARAASIALPFHLASL